MKPEAKRLPGLDVFRSIAILCVLACHLTQNGVAEGPDAIKLQVCLSLYGVQLFFVLSGFLIGSILIREFSSGEVSFAKLRVFWSRRWFRTLPNYYFYLLVSLLLERPWHKGEGSWWSYPFFLQNFAWSMPRFFIVSWSLCVEEWFYLLFPLLLVAAMLALPTRRRAAILSTIIIFLLVPFLFRWEIAGARNWILDVRMPVIYQLDAIGLGIAIAFIKFYHQELMMPLASVRALAGGVVLVAVMLVWTWRSTLEHFASFSGWQFALFFMLLNLSCAALLPWFANIQRIPEPACSIFTWTSILSYSLYLCHESAILISQIVFFHLGIMPNKGLVLLAWITGSILMAWMSYRFVERPFLRLRDTPARAKNVF